MPKKQIAEYPKDVRRYDAKDYLVQHRDLQEKIDSPDNENPLLTFAQIMATQALAEDPSLMPLDETEVNGKKVYKESPPLYNITELGAEYYQHNPYFLMWAVEKSVDDLRQAARDPAKALNEIRDVQKQSEKHYNDLGQRAEEAAKAGNVSGVMKETKSFHEAMKATGTGRNWLGAKRDGNSNEYNAMMEAIGNTMKDAWNETPEERAQNLALAVAATKKYLADKKTVRRTEDGKTRWENSMRFLQSAMPAEEFKAYCNEVNEKRGGRNQISPEQFAPPRTAEHTVQAAQQEMRDKGQITLQDVAKVAAAYELNISDTDGKLDPEKFQKSEIDPVDLAERTERLVRDPKFRQWYKAQGGAVLQKDMTKGHDGLGARIGHWNHPRPQDQELTNQLEAEEKQKAAKEAKKKEMRAFRTRLNKEKPEFFQELENEFNEIKSIEKTNPTAFKKRKAEFSEKMDHLLEEDRKTREKKPQDKEKPEGGKEKPQEKEKTEGGGGPVLGG